MDDLQLLSQTLAAIYETCFDDRQWPVALGFLQRFMRCTCAAVALESRDLNFPLFHTIGTSPEALHAYRTEFHHIDPVIALARKSPAGVACTDRMAIEPRLMEKTRFHAEYAAPLDMRHCLQAFTSRNEAHAGLFAVIRPVRDEPFSVEDCQRAELIIPHLRQALQVQRRLHSLDLQRLATLHLLDQLDLSAFLVDADMRVIFANQAAETLLRSARGLMTEGGRLGAALPADSARLRRSVGRAIYGELSSTHEPLAIRRACSSRPLLLRVVPFSARTADGVTGTGPAAFILGIDTEREWMADNDWPSGAFGFTRAEAKVARLLTDGLSPTQIAKALEVSLTTVRTHLSKIFDKTGSRRQAEVVALIKTLQVLR